MSLLRKIDMTKKWIDNPLIQIGLLTGLIILPFTVIDATAQTPRNAPQFQQVATQPFTDPSQVPQDLARIDQSLNNTMNFSGRFTQQNPDGSIDYGTIYLQRPGKLRFEYDAPNPLLVVSDGVTLVQQDRALETTDRFPLAATPLNYFLKENVNLANDTEVVSLIKDPREMRVTARDGSGEMDGEITMAFDIRTLALKGWTITDAFGGQTQLRLSDLQYNQRIDPRKFILRDDNRRDRRNR